MLTRKLWNKEARGSDESSSIHVSPPPPGISSDHRRSSALTSIFLPSLASLIREFMWILKFTESLALFRWSRKQKPRRLAPDSSCRSFWLVRLLLNSFYSFFLKKMESYKVEKDIKINLIYRNVIGNYLYSQFARVHLIILYSFCVEKGNDTYKRTLRSWEVW